MSMLEYRKSEFARLGSDLAAFELLRAAGTFEALSRKLERLVRRHRQQVFDPRSGDAHHRAILRLKRRTVTGKAVRHSNESRRQWVEGRRLEGMGY